MTDSIRSQLSPAWQQRYDLMQKACEDGVDAYPAQWWPSLSPLRRDERLQVMKAVLMAKGVLEKKGPESNDPGPEEKPAS